MLLYCRQTLKVWWQDFRLFRQVQFYAYLLELAFFMTFYYGLGWWLWLANPAAQMLAASSEYVAHRFFGLKHHAPLLAPQEPPQQATPPQITAPPTPQTSAPKFLIFLRWRVGSMFFATILLWWWQHSLPSFIAKLAADSVTQILIFILWRRYTGQRRA